MQVYKTHVTTPQMVVAVDPGQAGPRVCRANRVSPSPLIWVSGSAGLSVNLLCANPEMSSKELNEHLDLRAQNTGWGGSAELLSALPGGSLCPLQPAPQDFLSEGPQLPNNHFPLGV